MVMFMPMVMLIDTAMLSLLLLYGMVGGRACDACACACGEGSMVWKGGDVVVVGDICCVGEWLMLYPGDDDTGDDTPVFAKLVTRAGSANGDGENG